MSSKHFITMSELVDEMAEAGVDYQALLIPQPWVEEDEDHITNGQLDAMMEVKELEDLKFVRRRGNPRLTFADRVLDLNKGLENV